MERKEKRNNAIDIVNGGGRLKKEGIEGISERERRKDRYSWLGKE